MDHFADYLAHIRPTQRQYAWQKLESYGFIHFGMNTMTDREWGLGHEDPALFNPSALDAGQWVESLASAGLRGLILTCKHHDGFCLWPSQLTQHSVAASPWRDGQGDVVREVAEACAAHSMRFGVYLSPWDRTDARYGSGSDYDDYFTGQLTELLTSYGDIFTVWLDGACGEGPNGRRQIYDWDRYYRVIRALQPEAVISVCGPDVRWCGNEAGDTRPSEWSVVHRDLREAERTAAHSQQRDDPAFARRMATADRDLGSRAALAAAGAGIGDLVWYPSEVNTSIRPGWFHHPDQDNQVRSPADLLDLHTRAVGGNATLLLNIPPTRDGLVTPQDRQALAGLGQRLSDMDDAAITEVRSLTFSSSRPADPQTLLNPGDDDAGWVPDAGDRTPSCTVELPGGQWIGGAVVEEDIRHGQRVERIEVTATRGSREIPLAEAEAVGYRRTWLFPPVQAERLTVTVRQSRGRPRLRRLAILAPFLTAALALGALSGCASQSAAVGSVDGHTVTREEFAFHMDSLKRDIQNRINRDYPSDEPWDWNRSYDGTTPLEMLRDAAWENLAVDKVAFILGEENDLVDSTDFSRIWKAFEEENRYRAEAIAEGEIVYGPTEYSFIEYYGSALSELKTELGKKLSSGSDSALYVSDADVEARYDSEPEEWASNVAFYTLKRLEIPNPETADERDELMRLATEGLATGASLEEIAANLPGATVSDATINGADTLPVRGPEREELAAVETLAVGERTPVLEGSGGLVVDELIAKDVDRAAALDAYAVRIREAIVAERLDALIAERLAAADTEVTSEEMSTITLEDWNK